MSGGWIRATAVIGALGGGLWAALGLVSFCLEAGGCAGGPWVALEAAALLCLLVGTAGLHVRLREAYGRLGAAATALTVLGLLASLPPVLTGLYRGAAWPLWSWSYPLLVVGWTSLGLVFLRRSLASRVGAWLLVLALPVGLSVAYLSLFLLVPAFDLVVDENVLSAGPLVVYGVAWILAFRSL